VAPTVAGSIPVSHPRLIADVLTRIILLPNSVLLACEFLNLDTAFLGDLPVPRYERLKRLSTFFHHRSGKTIQTARHSDRFFEAPYASRST
jgi:hypothetical protein